MAKRKYKSYYDPDFCPAIAKRRITEEILMLLAGIGEVLATSGRCLIYNSSYPSRHAYHSATYRLRKAGLIAYRRGLKTAAMILTDKGEMQLSRAYKPMKFWKQDWNGVWYVLVYDVPEKDRRYRDALRGFLHSSRMGCLQRSVYVSPVDVRPEYDDLKRAAHIDEYSFLFASRTVLGQSALDIVRAAWNFDKLAESQSWFVKVCEDNLARIRSEKMTSEELTALAREESSAYGYVMKDDPLLPMELWPPEYLGDKAFSMHSEVVHEIAARL